MADADAGKDGGRKKNGKEGGFPLISAIAKSSEGPAERRDPKSGPGGSHPLPLPDVTLQQPALLVVYKPPGGVDTAIPEVSDETLLKSARAWADKALKKDYAEISAEYQRVLKDPVYRGLSFDAFKRAPRNLKRHETMVVWDRTRVVLKLPEDEERKSDFIHANYVSGPFTSRDYIVTQGPLPDTIGDFWAMVWQEKVFQIVMLCQCQEPERGGKGMKEKSAAYWKPDVGAVLDLAPHGRPMRVKTRSMALLSESGLRGVEVRRSSITLSRGGEDRNVYHWHVLNWPDMELPQHPLGTFHCLQLIKEEEKTMLANRKVVGDALSPTVVHCSAGVGRSCTLIALERIRYALLNPAYTGPPLDIPTLVTELRKERHFAVQTEGQYLYLYQAALVLLRDKGVIPQDAHIPLNPASPPPPGVKAKPCLSNEDEARDNQEGKEKEGDAEAKAAVARRPTKMDQRLKKHQHRLTRRPSKSPKRGL